MPLNPGDLNQRIEILRQTTTIERGEPVPSGWTSVGMVWAKVLGQNGREAVIGHVLEGISVYQITVRFRTDVLPSDQIRLAGGIDLNIKSIADPFGDREQLMIIASTDGAQKTS
jgi:head-tail adaptor